MPYISMDNKTTVSDDEATDYMLANTTEQERLETLTEWYFSGNWVHYETCARCGNVSSDIINELCQTCRKELNLWDG